MTDHGAAAAAMFAWDFAGRVLPFEAGAGAIMTLCSAGRHPIEKFDPLIAATALAAGAGIGIPRHWRVCRLRR